MRFGNALAITALLILLAAAGWFAYDGLTTGDAPAMSGHAYVAMALGIIFSIVIGGGLMTLLFYSSRRGYDEPPRLLNDRSSLPE